MNANPSSPKDRPTPLKASRAPHRKTNQAHERMDAAASRSRQGAREVDPAGPASRPARPSLANRCDCAAYPPAPVGCPISADINLVLDLSEDLNRAMRQLRRKLKACEKCPLDNPCGFRRTFQARVDAIIHEVNTEWGMP
jgi:hypothetical protein